MNKKPYLGAAISCFLDYARAFAALLVVLLHARLQVFGDMKTIRDANPGDDAAISALQIFTGHGHQAVMMFFVMSGYLIGGKILNEIAIGKEFWQRYYIDRMVRIWIVAVPAILISVFFAYLSLSFADSKPGVDAVNCAPSFDVVIGNIFFLHKVVVPVICSNGAYWSIANEVFYYILFPIIFIVLFSRALIFNKLIFSLLIVLLLVYAAYEPSSEGSILLYFPAWILGAALAQDGGSEARKKIVWLIALGGAMAAMLLQPTNVLFYDYMVIYFFAVIISIIRKKWLDSVKISPGISDFGKTSASFSYSLYLFHLPIINFIGGIAVYVLGIPLAQGGLSVKNFVVFILFVVVAYIFSYLAFVLFESKTMIVRGMITRKIISKP